MDGYTIGEWDGNQACMQALQSLEHCKSCTGVKMSRHNGLMMSLRLQSDYASDYAWKNTATAGKTEMALLRRESNYRTIGEM